MMISPKLNAIWPFFFLNLSQNLIVVLLMYFGTLGEIIAGQEQKAFAAQYL
jgi:hypothetical protein